MTTLEAQIQVEYGLFLLKKYLEELKAKNSPINAAIDKICGHDGTGEIKDNIIQVLNDIIEAKTFLGCDCEREKEIIKQIMMIKL